MSGDYSIWRWELHMGSHLVPLGCSSPTALYLMWVMLPLLISSSTSSSSSKGTRKALVGRASVNLLYLPCQLLQHVELPSIGHPADKHEDKSDCSQHRCLHAVFEVICCTNGWLKHDQVDIITMVCRPAMGYEDPLEVIKDLGVHGRGHDIPVRDAVLAMPLLQIVFQLAKVDWQEACTWSPLYMYHTSLLLSAAAHAKQHDIHVHWIKTESKYRTSSSKLACSLAEKSNGISSAVLVQAAQTVLHACHRIACMFALLSKTLLCLLKGYSRHLTCSLAWTRLLHIGSFL